MKINRLLISLIFMTIISFFIGFSYAYFTVTVFGNEDILSNNIKTAHLTMLFDGSDYLKLENAEPGDFESFNFSVTNTGKLSISSYEIYL